MIDFSARVRAMSCPTRLLTARRNEGSVGFGEDSKPATFARVIPSARERPEQRNNPIFLASQLGKAKVAAMLGSN